MKPSAILSFFVAIALVATALMAAVAVTTPFAHAAPATLSKLTIKGLEGVLHDNVSTLTQQSLPPCKATTTAIKRFSKQLPQYIKQALQPYGYYAPTSHIEYRKTEQCWVLSATVSAGTQISVRQLTITLNGEGKHDADLLALISNSTVQRTSALNHAAYEALKSSLLAHAAEKGYLDTTLVTHRVDVYPEQAAADITLVIDTQQRYRIGEVIIQAKDDFLDPEFIQHWVELSPEQYFTISDLYRSRRQLLATQYFADVEVKLDTTRQQAGYVPVIITVTPGYRTHYRTGMGFSTDTGPRLTFDYSNQRTNRRGDQFQARLSLSEVVSELTAGIKFPSRKHPATQWYNLDAGYQRENSDSVKSDITKLGLTHVRQFKSGWQRSVFVDLINEQFETDTDEGSSLLLVPGISFSYTQADNPTRPQQGYRLQASAKAASEALLADTSFTQLTLGYKQILSWNPQHRLLARTSLGATLAEDFEEIPASYRFFTGGDTSIRGFDYRALSPLDNDEELSGGQYLAVASVEYEYLWASSWGVAVFTDVGNAFNDTFEIAQSVGVGLRWFSPIGPIRIDIAVPVSQGEDDFRLHINLGPDL